MYYTIKIIKLLLVERFALFQDKICIAESGINNSYILDSFLKQFWEKDPIDKIMYHFFRDLLFPSILFQYKGSTYMLTLMMEEQETSYWTESDWQLLTEKIHVVLLTITREQTYESLRKEHAFSSYHHEEKIREKLLPEETNDFIDNYQFEKNFIQQLKSGDPLILTKLLQNLSKINQTPLSTDKLMENKYRLISIITLMTRAAIENGSPPSDAYRLSDKLIRDLDELTTLSEIKLFSQKMVYEFSIFIRKRTLPSTSILIRQAGSYINSHLYENLTNIEIAEYIGVNPSYLSSQFKKQTGTSLRRFIIKAKINEAKYLLTHTDLSFKEISESLHFANQSHFCKLFKEQTTYTPKEFRTLF
ncbi:helix-turn-helix domain-containing protein [Enterococcus gallinarum]|uniref:helix-turn-helix domain-containing protein n=1 Tax=Enterococcus gallinarum TaxID=1353 RepID=UPI003D6AEBF0